ncbi:PREDICTED: uncharacterized protein LOC107880887 [Prunus mume]|uniref:Uncharacterized protein LOC107880887 n=1 Tax=Prunus mume TaxID=102107 RepID=A0ABM1LNB9_PRUMU|nr:PREDICTED: uncharacterized protein LOC107880887 [Prunus mume]
MVIKHADHPFNICKKPDESLRDYLTRFKVEKANIIGCNDQVASSSFKKGLPTEHELYRELAITPSQTLREVFARAERYPLWEDDRITAKKASKQIDHPTKQASQKSNKFEQKARDKRRWRSQEGGSETGTFTDFVIPIHQILAQVKDKPWVRRRPPMRGDPSKRDTSKYCAFHGEYDHYTNNCNSELTTKERKRKIGQATYVSQVTTGVLVTMDTPIIGFHKKDLIRLDLPHNDALVICIQIEQPEIERVHVDEGSTANILQLSVIQQIGLEPKISKLARSLTGFNGATSITIGTIDLEIHSPPVDQGEGIRSEDSPEKGWKSEDDVELVPPDPGQLDKEARTGLRQNPNKKDQDEGIRPEGSLEKGWKPEEDVEFVPLDPDQPDKKTRIGSRLSPDKKVELTTFLQNNKDMFHMVAI